ncbi:hypothetical protein HOP54_00065 [Halomonas daqingensis]|uniref:glycosyltransferase family 52 n=1 Tax=Billgrantia desiderata TaxID=52021 RepID=UPI001F4016AC|nr:glycosyltransferase family 52 [Halomonas desiderata]MCE8027084.1 hypothetical protein [Halomonas desiderata]
MCLTPFHCHVALSVAKKKGVVRNSVFFISTGDAEKFFESSITRLMNEGVSRRCVIKLGKKINIISYWPFVKYRKSVFYAANIKMFYTRIVIRLIAPSKIITFDDGFANVSGGGYFYTKDEGKIKRLTLKLLGLPDYYSLVSMVEEHFTIYPELRNVYNVTDCVKLSYRNESPGGSINANKWYGLVFVGSPLSESGLVDVNIEVEKIAEAVSNFDVPKLYLCHPRDGKEKINLIRSRLPELKIYQHDDIAEMFLIEEKNNISAVVGFYSSTLLNVLGEFPGAVYGKRINLKTSSVSYSNLINLGVLVLD